MHGYFRTLKRKHNEGNKNQKIKLRRIGYCTHVFYFFVCTLYMYICFKIEILYVNFFPCGVFSPILSIYCKQHNFILLLFFFCGTGVWTQGIHLEALHQSFFFLFSCDRFFCFFNKIGSCELFSQPGLELWSSWSLPSE
jgi:hypothetical protein